MSNSDLHLHRERQERARRFRQPRRTVRDAGPQSAAGDAESKDASAQLVPGALPDESLRTSSPASSAAAARIAQRAAARRRRSNILVKTLLLTVELLLLGAAVYGLLQLHRQTRPVSFELRYLVPNKADLVEAVSAGSSTALHEPVELEGYTFLYWERPDGTPETEAEVTPAQDTVYTARYALAFPTEKHIPYLSVDEDGVVGVNDPVTMRELVSILYDLLDLDRTGKGEFLDVEKDDSCYKAAATLKDLGILQGDWLYPDDRVSRAELLGLLSRFYPPAEAPAVFSDLDPDDDSWPAFCVAAERGWIDEGAAEPAASVCRGELARIMNRVLGRAPIYMQPDSAVGMILDVPPTHPYYADVAEAVIPHTYTKEEGFERWLESAPLPAHEPGLFFVGVRLHYIGEDGTVAVNTTVDGRSYNECGEMTSGNNELDRRLWEILESTVDPESMSGEEMLRAVYLYTVGNFLHNGDAIYPLGTDDWAADAALRMLNEGKGSSHGYAGLFYELATFVGYQPKLISGVIYGQQKKFEAVDGTEVNAPKGYMPHAWVEMPYQGTSYIYDAEMEAKYNGLRSFFRVYDPVRWQKGYRSNF